MYKLYSFARSSTAWRARIALNLKNIQVEYVYLNLLTGQHRNPEYRKINPNTGVPTLVLPDGTKLVQSLAIIEYLNEVHREPNDLFPGSPAQRALIRGFCEVINSGIHPYQNLRLLQKIEKDYGTKRAQWATFWIKNGLGAVENLVSEHNKGGKYVFGDNLTAADVVLFPQIYNSVTRYHIDMKEFPNTDRVYRNLEQVQAIQDAAPQNQKDFK